MYVGNAKTYFQPLGKSESSSGYLMSPFGDDRWDLDDQEKLGKVFRKIEKPVVANSNPKNENVQMRQVHPVQCSSSNILPQEQNFKTNVQTGLPNQTCGGPLDALRREKMFGPAHVLDVKRTLHSNGGVLSMNNNQSKSHQYQHQLQQEEQRVKQPMRIQETYDFSPCGNSVELCDSCQEKTKAEMNNHYQSGVWKSSPDVPVLIAGGTSYLPMGPQSATPNPLFPPQERNFYSPLR